MNRATFDHRWWSLAQEVLTGMKEWRLQHPTATFSQIEAALDERLGHLRARMLEDVAMASEATTFRQGRATDRPTCPSCGTPLHSRGEATRHLKTHAGQEITLTRSYGTCPACGRGFFPLDEQLGLLPGSLTPRLQEHLVRLGSWLEFDPAAQLLAALTGAQVTEATARRRTEEAGALLGAWQEQEVARLERECPAAPEGPLKQFLGVDGCFVPLLHGQWQEVRTLAIGVIGEPVFHAQEQEWVAPTRELSYFSRLTDADTFGRLALVETHRRGTEMAGAVAAVTDGAEWEQGFIDRHRPDAVRILDFPHGAQRLSPIAQAVWGTRCEEATRWVQEQTRRLKEEGPTGVLAEIAALESASPQADGLAEHRGYLQKRAGQVQYPQYRAGGLPIGSGAVESANKLVVEARLKGAGMHWERSHVDPMLALRNAVCSNRWAEAWERIARGLREQGAHRRTERQQQREGEEERAEEERRADEVVPAPVAGVGDRPAEAGKRGAVAGTERRPAANHPWRRFHISRTTEPPRAVMMHAKQ